VSTAFLRLAEFQSIGRHQSLSISGDVNLSIFVWYLSALAQAINSGFRSEIEESEQKNVSHLTA
jgi:hypothetical protein